MDVKAAVMLNRQFLEKQFSGVLCGFRGQLHGPFLSQQYFYSIKNFKMWGFLFVFLFTDQLILIKTALGNLIPN